MDTWLTNNLGLRVPVVSAPMAGVAEGALAAAVSRAGALGTVGVGARSAPDWVTQQCRSAAASGASFGVGLKAWALEHNPDQLDAVLGAGASLVMALTMRIWRSWTTYSTRRERQRPELSPSAWPTTASAMRVT